MLSSSQSTHRPSVAAYCTCSLRSSLDFLYGTVVPTASKQAQHASMLCCVCCCYCCYCYCCCVVGCCVVQSTTNKQNTIITGTRYHIYIRTHSPTASTFNAKYINCANTNKSNQIKLIQIKSTSYNAWKRRKR